MNEVNALANKTGGYFGDWLSQWTESARPYASMEKASCEAAAGGETVAPTSSASPPTSSSRTSYWIVPRVKLFKGETFLKIGQQERVTCDNIPPQGDC